jgi:hypothetical protein
MAMKVTYRHQDRHRTRAEPRLRHNRAVTATVRLLIWSVVGLLALSGAASIGFVIGNDGGPPAVATHTGSAALSPHSGTATAGGFSYVLPVNVPWIDTAGTIHNGPGPPPCLRSGGGNRVVFGTVRYPIAGATQGIVVWVRC